MFPSAFLKNLFQKSAWGPKNLILRIPRKIMTIR